ncbi:hypothetical protein B484DRAFT_52877 [Ochromonadaceae sp. CCMP2298]|nr:hypothetical protein B484DRAFT_52877 [Ochromonadaceae sp. CCMP2298]
MNDMDGDEYTSEPEDTIGFESNKHPSRCMSDLNVKWSLKGESEGGKGGGEGGRARGRGGSKKISSGDGDSNGDVSPLARSGKNPSIKGPSQKDPFQRNLSPSDKTPSPSISPSQNTPSPSRPSKIEESTAYGTKRVVGVLPPASASLKLDTRSMRSWYAGREATDLSQVT